MCLTPCAPDLCGVLHKGLLRAQVVGLQPSASGWATFWLFNFLMHQFAVSIRSGPSPLSWSITSACWLRALQCAPADHKLLSEYVVIHPIPLPDQIQIYGPTLAQMLTPLPKIPYAALLELQFFGHQHRWRCSGWSVPPARRPLSQMLHREPPSWSTSCLQRLQRLTDTRYCRLLAGTRQWQNHFSLAFVRWIIATQQIA